jgi:uridylate kinase
MKSNQPVFRRVLLKLSGESLLDHESYGIDLGAADRICRSVAEIVNLGVAVSIVIGGGNLFRGAQLIGAGLPQVTSDHVGMLATIMNGLVLRECFLRANIPAQTFSAWGISGVVNPFDRSQALDCLARGQVVILAGGTGNPLFTTDSAASLRGIELGADILLKATKVDGVYSADPKKDKHAERFQKLNYQEVIDRKLAVMDLTAVCLCQAYALKIRVFNMNEPGILKRIVLGGDEGTLVS